MLDDYGFEVFEENPFPIAYLITFRTYGTWLHGDPEGSVQRGIGGSKSSASRSVNIPLREKMSEELRHAPTVLNDRQRELVRAAIVEVCEYREYELKALNVRSNHTHAVISKWIKPEKIVNDLKAYSTRKLRTEGEFGGEAKIWSRGRSTRYLWKPRNVEAAVEYVLYSQGDVPPETIFVD